MSEYTPAATRYDNADFFRRCGRTGLKLPAISLGCWHNFGTEADPDNARQMLYTAFDHGVTHFDLANNYGPLPGSAESRVGDILKAMPRDELIISTKAGFTMWDGPYGDFGSRKYLIASLDQSLKRLGLDYVDIFYHHRPDPETPVEETMAALDTIVKQGKAIYAGISNYSGDGTAACVDAIKRHDWSPLVIHQASYSMLNRWVENDLLPVTARTGLGVIAFCPLSQGLLTDKYLGGIPEDSRAAGSSVFLKRESVQEQVIAKVRKLNDHAKRRGQTLAQMALAWVLRDSRVTSALIGASKPEQIIDNVKSLNNATFSDDELTTFDEILKA